ncbi:hypothetical protein Q7P35_010483 [Cladosporium inversicolor]
MLVLGELHLHGAKSTRLDQIKRAAKLFLGTAESNGPDQTFAYAFLLWAFVHTGSCAFILAKMMLAQAMVLVDVQDEILDAQAKGGEMLLKAGCYVVETILSLTCGVQMSTIAVDLDASTIGDVGEWDPFINILEQRKSITASNYSTQLPPCRTGSTFKALVVLMAILRKTRDACSDPEVLAADLQAWEASLPTDLRGAVTAESTESRAPVPSQLNLRLWYGTLHGMIAQLRQGATGTASNAIPSGLALQRIDALKVADQAYGSRMLPATSSVLLLQISQLTAAAYASPDALPVVYKHSASEFMDHWGRTDANRGVQHDLTSTAAQGPRIDIHQSVTAPSLIEGSTIGTTGLERQASALGNFSYTADAAMGSTIQPDFQAIGNVNGIQPFSRWRLNNEASLPSADTATAADVHSCMEDPASYDLLEYLTMFENNDGDNTEYMEPLGFVSGLHDPA